MNDFYVYIHIRNDLLTPFYVGKGRDNRAWVVKNRNKHWRAIVNKAGGHDIQILKTKLSESEAFDLEKKLIAGYRSKGLKLANQSDGGEGLWNPSNEVRKAMSDVKKGKRIPPEVRQKMSLAQKGKKFSDETRLKIAKAKRGIPRDKETRAKLSVALLGKPSGRAGKPLSKLHVKALKEAKKGWRWFTDGVNQICCLPEDKPEGWVSGRTSGYKIADTRKMSEAKKGNTHTKGLKWYNNGIESRMINPDSNIPYGWMQGRLKWRAVNAKM